jgi:hypothetical protein
VSTGALVHPMTFGAYDADSSFALLQQIASVTGLDPSDDRIRQCMCLLPPNSVTDAFNLRLTRALLSVQALLEDRERGIVLQRSVQEDQSVPSFAASPGSARPRPSPPPIAAAATATPAATPTQANSGLITCAPLHLLPP